MRGLRNKGQLKTPGTQIGNPIEVFIWLVIKINDQTVFRSNLAKDVSTHVPVCGFIYKKTVNFLRTSICYFLFAF